MKNEHEIGKNILNNLSSGKIKFIFPPIDNYQNLMISTEGLYSITSYKYADKMTDIIDKLYGSNITIVDATANVGGNTISFSKKFSRVISIEKNKNTFLMLKNNVKAYGLEKKNKLLNGDCVKIIPKLNEKIDIIFIDPPWGGKSYTKFKFLYLLLSGINIVDIVKLFYSYTKTFAIKVPFNFNFSHFFRKLDYPRFEVHKIHFKYYLLILTN